mgnify:FL=1
MLLYTNPDQYYWYRYSGPLQLFQNPIPKNQIIPKLYTISLLFLKYQVFKRQNLVSAYHICRYCLCDVYEISKDPIVSL